MMGLSKSTRTCALLATLTVVAVGRAEGLRVTAPTTAPATRLRPGQTITIGDGTTPHGEVHRVVPDAHTVRRGDTLWDICDSYFGDPWQWPKVWSFNPDIVNPHWIYPGEVVRLRRGAGIETAAPSGSPPSTAGARSPGLSLRPRSVTPDTVFLRDQGFLYDDQVEDDGEVSGSPEDKMLLSTHDRVYVKLGKRTAQQVQVGSVLTIFQKTRPVRAKNGDTVGQVLQILGTIRVDLVDRPHDLAEGTIIEALDVIERGAHVGPIERKLHVVPPTTNEGELRGEILASVHPNQMYGQNQIVFIDKGEAAGVRLGNRYFVVRKGDPWQEGLSSTGQYTAQKVTLSLDGPAEVTTNRGEQLSSYPEEIIAEIRVVSLRKTTATCLVTASRRELVPGDAWVAMKGY